MKNLKSRKGALDMAEIIDFEYGKWTKHYKPPKGIKTEGCHGCMAPVEDCKNPASYGTLCVLCNLCGRFGEYEEE